LNRASEGKKEKRDKMHEGTGMDTTGCIRKIVVGGEDEGIGRCAMLL
jgi:hypothetical protein